MYNTGSRKKAVIVVVVPLVILILILAFLLFTVSVAQLSNVRPSINVLRTDYIALTGATIIIIIAYLIFILRRLTRPHIFIDHIASEISKNNFNIKIQDVFHEKIDDTTRNLALLINQLKKYKETSDRTEEGNRETIRQAVEQQTKQMRNEMMTNQDLAAEMDSMIKRLKESEDELKDKTNELRSSNEQLEESKKKLNRFNQELEKEVNARTAKLEAAKNNIQNLLETKSKFVTQVSHDLRTPLMPILTLLPIIKQTAPQDNKDFIEMIDKVLNNAQYLSEIVTHTLSISRLDSGKIKLVLEPSNLYNIVEEVISSNSEVFEKQGAQVINRVERDIPNIMVDKMRIREILNNLITNAIKFTKDDKRIEVSAKMAGGQVTVSVRDYGIGIAPEHLDKIFEEFFKVDSSRHEHASGLGLAICKRMVEKHGGKIWAVSDGLGTGTTFKFTLPIHNE